MVTTSLGGVLALPADLWRAAGHVLLAPPSMSALAVTVLAGAVLAGVLAAWFVSGAGPGRPFGPLTLLRRAALRRRSWRAAFIRQRDPDAAGRPRPRAPSAAPAAALR
ncbi:MAG TPA: DUF6412 domain-containing protein [Streptosporangiaceae bacterium]|nr:DUF6412 domain-containing protein [Streptosporangiaceae bacterium]